jgi:hypothetical protein
MGSPFHLVGNSVQLLHLGKRAAHNEGKSRVAAAVPRGRRRTMAMPGADSDELARFGYKQELG